MNSSKPRRLPHCSHILFQDGRFGCGGEVAWIVGGGRESVASQ